MDTTMLENILSVIFCIIGLVGLYKIFEKMGEPGWKGIVPLYNIYLLFDKLIDKMYGIGYICAVLVMSVCTALLQTSSPNNVFLAVINIVASVAVLALTIMLMIRLGKAFGKSNAFIVGLVLLTPIFELMLGFDDSVYAPGQREEKEIQI